MLYHSLTFFQDFSSIQRKSGIITKIGDYVEQKIYIISFSSFSLFLSKKRLL
ncbi:hypothetical protein CP10139811_0974 [Chlamydia ibidis]|uniref:Uncharacterized protein n=1 Tax=Chlamydia ibidis TaxID=1405396 RepID=S7J4X3_9CHLA|nr:hypothetical protein CP10139811_0974 [Chlamydia ibidis]